MDRAPVFGTGCRGFESLQGHVSRATKAKHHKRHLLADIFGWECFYCNKPIRCIVCHPDVSIRSVATLDHLIPRSKGGTLANSNLVLACPKCNRKKADQIICLTSRQKKLQQFGAQCRSEQWKEVIAT